jgi:dephospho-CoA kinase
MITLRDELRRRSAADRLYRLDRPILGLTGGIATGKSSVTRLLEARGLAVIDADKLVKEIYAGDEAREFVRTKFPAAWDDGVDFRKLREVVFTDAAAKARVEGFIYQRLPAVFEAGARRVTGQDFLVYDVPLLFERKLEPLLDATALVYAPRKLQRARLQRRDAIDGSAADRILAAQLDIEEKRRRADFVIDNSGTEAELAANVETFLARVLVPG